MKALPPSRSFGGGPRSALSQCLLTRDTTGQGTHSEAGCHPRPTRRWPTRVPRAAQLADHQRFEGAADAYATSSATGIPPRGSSPTTMSCSVASWPRAAPSRRPASRRVAKCMAHLNAWLTSVRSVTPVRGGYPARDQDRWSPFPFPAGTRPAAWAHYGVP